MSRDRSRSMDPAFAVLGIGKDDKSKYFLTDMSPKRFVLFFILTTINLQVTKELQILSSGKDY